MLMCLIARQQLLTMHVCAVDPRSDTGTHKVEDMIRQIATGKTFQCTDLIPILDAYNACDLKKGHTAWDLRTALRSRLTKDATETKAAAVARDTNGSNDVDQPVKMWPIFGGK